MLVSYKNAFCTISVIVVQLIPIKNISKRKSIESAFHTVKGRRAFQSA